MMPIVFDICKGAIPGSPNLFFPGSMVTNTCLTIGGVSAFAFVTNQALKRLPYFNTPQWHVYRLIQKAPSLSNRQIVIGGGALVLSACIIVAFYPYLSFFLNSPFPSAFSLRFRQLSKSAITAVVGVGVFVGTTFISSFFGMNIFSDPFKPLNQLKVTFFGPRQKIWRPDSPESKANGASSTTLIASLMSIFRNTRGPQSEIPVPKSLDAVPAAPNDLLENRTQKPPGQPIEKSPELGLDESTSRGREICPKSTNKPVSTDSTAISCDSDRTPLQTLDWTSLPADIFRVYIFPRALNKTSTFQDFFAFGQICKILRAHLLDPVCLIPRSPYRHFLWHVFRKQEFDPIEVTAFFQMYLPEGHQGDGLRLPMRFLYDGFVGLKNSVTPAQLGYIFEVFPKASIDSIAVRLGGDDDVGQVAHAINACLEPSKKTFSLTIIPEIIRNPEEANLYGKLLSKQQFKDRNSFRALRNSQLEKAQKNYPSQVMKLIPLLKGRVTLVRIDFRRHSGDSDLNPRKLMELLKPTTGPQPLSVDRVYFAYTWTLKCKPPEDIEAIERIIKPKREDIEYPPESPKDSLIDETLIEETEIDRPQGPNFFRVDYLN
jgi:hypothetical protein